MMKKLLVIVVLLVSVISFTQAQAQYGNSAAQLQKLFQVMEDKSLSAEQVIELIKNSSVLSEKVSDITNEIKLVVDYNKTIEQAVKDGHYDWKRNDINDQNFPISPEMIGKKVEIRVKIFHFNSYVIKSDDVISEMDSAGYRPATLMELLAFGAIYPESQRRFSIIALGSFWHSADFHCYVPGLDVIGSLRRLSFGLFDFGWDAYDCFLGVRK